MRTGKVRTGATAWGSEPSRGRYKVDGDRLVFVASPTDQKAVPFAVEGDEMWYANEEDDDVLYHRSVRPDLDPGSMPK